MPDIVLDSGIAGEERWRKNPLYIPGEEIQTLNKSKEGYLILYEKEIRAMATGTGQRFCLAVPP